MAAKKTIIVTGATSGIGLMIANRLHREGHIVLGTSRYPEKNIKNVLFPLLKLNFTSQESIDGFMKEALSLSPSVDVLINNAGDMLSGIAEETKTADARNQFETNFWGTVNVTMAILPHFREQKKGQIISIGSIMGLVGMPAAGFYTASKHALEGFFKSIRFELKDFNIAVSMVEPTNFKSNIVHNGVSSAVQLGDYDQLRNKLNSFWETLMVSSPEPYPIAEKIIELVNSSKPKFANPVGKGSKLLPALQKISYEFYETAYRKNAKL